MSEVSCDNCEKLKIFYKDGVHWGICIHANEYKITCTVSKCPEYVQRRLEDEKRLQTTSDHNNF